MGVIYWVKTISCASTNVSLLKLKLSFFFYYSAWYATQPYISIMQTQIVTYHHLAVIYALSPVATICGSVITGFISDKLGNYKRLTVIGVVFAGTGPFGILWLYYDHQQYQPLNQYNKTTVNITSDDLSQSMKPVSEPAYTLPLMMIFLLMGLYSTTSNDTLLEVCGLSVCKKHDADFARQKLWGYIGMALSPVMCGVLVDLVSKYLGHQDDSAAFWVGAVFTVLAVPFLAQLDVEVEKNKRSIFSTIKHVVVMIDFDFFIVVEIIAGLCYSFHAIYRPVFAAELQASKTLIGLLLTASGIGTTAVLCFIKLIIGRLGEANTLVISLLLFSARFFMFYYLQNPWLLLLTELVDGCCGFTAIIAGSYYCAAEAPPGMLGSLNGILSAVIYGAGRALGTSVGSKLIGLYGIRTTYLLGGYLAGGTAVIYFLTNHFFLRKIRHKRHLKKNKGESKEVCGTLISVGELKEIPMIP